MLCADEQRLPLTGDGHDLVALALHFWLQGRQRSLPREQRNFRLAKGGSRPPKPQGEWGKHLPRIQWGMGRCIDAHGPRRAWPGRFSTGLTAVCATRCESLLGHPVM